MVTLKTVLRKAATKKTTRNSTATEKTTTTRENTTAKTEHERDEYSNGGYNNGAEDSQEESSDEEYSHTEHNSGEGSHKKLNKATENTTMAQDSHEPGVEESREQVAATCNLDTKFSSPAKTPKLPRYLSGRTNWKKRESYPAVRDFLMNNEDMQTKGC